MNNVKWRGWQNSTERQGFLLNLLCNRLDFIACDPDKNLGMLIMGRKDYILRSLNDHLLHPETYFCLGPGKLEFRDDTIPTCVRNIILHAEKQKLLKDHDITYLKQALVQYYRIPHFNTLMKLHKDKLGSRPVTETGGSLLAALLKLVDVYLQLLAEFPSCCICDWDYLLDLMDGVSSLTEGGEIFTSDTTSIITSIDTEHVLEVLCLWLNSLKRKVKLR